MEESKGRKTMKTIKRRHELKQEHTWDLTRLFKTEADYEKALNEVLEKINNFKQTYENNLTSPQVISESIKDYDDISRNLSYVSSYASLNISVDQTNEQNVMRSGVLGSNFGKISKDLAFYGSSLEMLDEETLLKVRDLSPLNVGFINEVLKQKKHALKPEINQALSEFSQVFSAPYRNYDKFKFADMTFNEFTVHNEKHPLSFTLFENEWEYDVNHDVRRKAYESFYDTLKLYENGLANNYQTHVLTEKAYANLKGFDSVIDYLLYDQDVTRDMYDRQIDVIMDKLSEPMRKYARLLKRIHGLEEMTYADLKIAIDHEFEPTITIEESEKYMMEGLKVLGDDYLEMVEKSFKERWIDFPQNLGKSTGGFCSSPYQKGSYILLNWNNKMDETFVLAHELGHAGHFYFAGKHQNYFDNRPSLYFIEAPSTMNELLMGEYLKSQSNDLRFKRWVLSSLVARTYYHNMVTHLLEATYQREVYRYVDEKKPLSASVLKSLKLKALKDFWKDDVVIPDYAGLTWMRQPHYFMGLYPYTYSAGLTIATAVVKKVNEGKLDIERWKDVLRAGGTKNPLELAKMVDVDLSTKQPLLDTISYVSDMVDEIERITNILEGK